MKSGAKVPKGSPEVVSVHAEGLWAGACTGVARAVGVERGAEGHLDMLGNDVDGPLREPGPVKGGPRIVPGADNARGLEDRDRRLGS